MGLQIALIAAMMILTAATHMMGLSILESVSRRFARHPARRLQVLVLLGLALALLALHVVEILQYALLYRALGAFDFEAAVYFSGGAYSTIGVPDVQLPQAWRLIGAMEGVNGMVMIGWSTAYLFSAWQEVVRPDD